MRGWFAPKNYTVLDKSWMDMVLGINTRLIAVEKKLSNEEQKQEFSATTNSEAGSVKLLKKKQRKSKSKKK